MLDYFFCPGMNISIILCMIMHLKFILLLCYIIISCHVTCVNVHTRYFSSCQFIIIDGQLVLVFEYMEVDLWRCISGPNANVPLLQTKCIMKQLFEGLSQCHSAGIMHRDVKRMSSIFLSVLFSSSVFFYPVPHHHLHRHSIRSSSTLL